MPPLNFDQELEELRKGMGGSSIPEGSFGPMPDLPTPTLEDLRKEGLIGKDGDIPEWIRCVLDTPGNARWTTQLWGGV
jgi:hypothetical protein